ncbi:MAG: 30S ribosomal protein S16 [Bacteroidetes bacterium]|nr:30S ribosomal protein S16 [Bacteroidota bacterium]
MPVKIRLARHGKKNYPFYFIVAADERAPRDGKFIEKIGTYNPNTNPATIELSIDKALTWLDNGAQPTDTCRTILSSTGVMMKKHLLGGVKKGAFTIEVAEARFEKWLQEKQKQNDAAQTKLADAATSKKAANLAEEMRVNTARATALAKRAQEATAKVEEAKAPATEEAPAE